MSRGAWRIKMLIPIVIIIILLVQGFKHDSLTGGLCGLAAYAVLILFTKIGSPEP